MLKRQSVLIKNKSSAFLISTRDTRDIWMSAPNQLKTTEKKPPSQLNFPELADDHLGVELKDFPWNLHK